MRMRRVVLGDVAAVKVVHDPSLPDGHAFWVELHSLPAGTYFVAGARCYNEFLGCWPAQLVRGNSAESCGGSRQKQRRRQRAGWMRSCCWRTCQLRRACLRCAGRLRLVPRWLEMMVLQDRAHKRDEDGSAASDVATPRGLRCCTNKAACAHASCKLASCLPALAKHCS